MNRLVALALAGLGLVLAGCNGPAPSQPQATQSQRPVYPQQTYTESRRSERYEGGGRADAPQRRGRSQAEDTPGAFDFYLLSLSWSPEFCLTHPQAAECASHPGFVLHGLWPQNSDGSYPENCGRAQEAPGPANPEQYRDIYPDQGLLQHEWKTHGTCSGLGADAYFSKERQALRSIKIPRALAAVQSEIQLTPQQILSDFAQANPETSADDFALSCGNNRLTAVEVCLSKDLRATSCNSVRTCRANVVKVTPPGAE